MENRLLPSSLKENIKNYFDDLDRKYPNRHKEIHKVPCKNCPSTKGPDPEDEELRGLPKEFIAKEVLFVCYCRESKLCKGLCDNHGITQEYLNRLYSNG